MRSGREEEGPRLGEAGVKPNSKYYIDTITTVFITMIMITLLIVVVIVSILMRHGLRKQTSTLITFTVVNSIIS